MTALARAAHTLLFATVLMLAPAARAAETIIAGGVSSASANLWPIYIGIKKGFFASAAQNRPHFFAVEQRHHPTNASAPWRGRKSGSLGDPARRPLNP